MRNYWCFIFCLIIWSLNYKAYCQGEINIRLGDLSGASMFNACVSYQGILTVNTTTTITVVVENLHPTETLTLNTYTPFNPPQFTIATNNCEPSNTLAPNSSCIITLNITPNVSGTFENRLVINSSDLDESNYELKFAYSVLEPIMNGKKLILNEVSNGQAGIQEYIEFLVVGIPGTYQDVRNWAFDDNSGRGSTCEASRGVAKGHCRLANHPQWECIPVGSLIVIYNPNDKNPAITMPDDPTDANFDGVYIMPINNTTYISTYDLCPELGPSPTQCNYFGCPASGTGIWDYIGMRNAGDMFQLIDPADLSNFHHSVSWGDVTGSGSTIQFAGSATNKTIQFVNSTSDDPFLQANWQMVQASGGGDTPGLPNSTQNASWIESVQFKIFACIQSDCQIFLSTNATEDVSSFEWDFENDGTVDLTTTVPFTNHTYGNAGSYTCRVKLNTTGSCASQTRVTDIDLSSCTPFTYNKEVFTAIYNALKRTVKINWQTFDPQIISFTIQRAVNNGIFEDLQTVNRKASKSESQESYQFFDYNLPFNANNAIYRIRLNGNNTYRYTNLKYIDLSYQSGIKIYPNPAQSIIKIVTPEAISCVSIYDALGKIHKKIEFNDIHTPELSIDDLPIGVYWLQIQMLNASKFEMFVKN